ncbi:MAG: beta-glucuronidase, partial [Oscillospiraceae bacterium]|nr:beta-glucuronidase [Oscillospiraceae bacterium]
MFIIDLSGRWDVCLDSEKRELSPEVYPDSIVLPDSTSNAGLGKLNEEIEYGCLTDMHKFEGYAWFRRTVTIPDECEGKSLTLFLERTRMTAIYIDGREFRYGDSLCSPHRFVLNGLSAGEHELVIRVNNTDYPTGGGHMTSRDTQTNWNGIIGRMELQCYTAYPEAVYLFTDVIDKKVIVRAEISGVQHGCAELCVYDDAEKYGECTAEYKDGLLEAEIVLSDVVPLWDEFSPSLIKLDIKIGEDVRTVVFGMREMAADGLKLLVNGRQTFLRGKHD